MKVGSLEDAIADAMDYCIANGILVEYLERHGSEVRNMLFTEWKLEDAQQVWLEEGSEEGIEIGREKGIEIGILETARSMFVEGFNIEVISRVTKMPLDMLKEKLRVQ